MMRRLNFPARRRFEDGVVKPLALALACSPVLALPALAHPDDVFWSGEFGRPGTGGRTHTVDVIEMYGGDLYVGGSFNSATDQLAGGIARWDGSGWHGLAESCNGTIHAIYFDGTDVYAGGSFSEIDGVPANRIARWNGSTWSALGTGLGAGGVQAILRHDGDLYVGGVFYTAGGTTTPSIARWDGSTWHAVGSGIDPFYLFDGVYALASDGTDLIVAGQFETIGALSVYNVARWDGSAWSAMEAGLSLSGQVGVVVYHGDLVAGGTFRHVGRNPREWNRPLERVELGGARHRAPGRIRTGEFSCSGRKFPVRRGPVRDGRRVAPHREQRRPLEWTRVV